MEKGIIYIMTTVIKGLIKIGKTKTDQFENRMKHLENNGYANTTGLKREFAIEVEGYDAKEKLIHNIFSKSRIGESELFALDLEIAKSLFSSLDGKQIYPVDKSKKEIFKEATEELEIKCIPDGEYILKRTVRGFGEINGKAFVEDGVFTLKKGSICANPSKGHMPSIIKRAKMKNNVLQEDIICSSPSTAGWIVIGKSNNGWTEWKDLDGNPIQKYRKNVNDKD
ncbi:DUF4357 domain-containing protein [Oceanivirga miroungae]|uniref:Bacteriophage T5 Orf172 DNA-binding domain-containing protein n=1 Tax=Oceanivirga miroungae TaxID=1130046 RepID=A0A6I8M6I2_9FUSO|nr:DUF4357 domain-containing protein [Oceanivirga miroungae]VWL84973.1 hypothetical protein OMES3154_00245 [Oceanivirga miroungae]